MSDLIQKRLGSNLQVKIQCLQYTVSNIISFLFENMCKLSDPLIILPFQFLEDSSCHSFSQSHIDDGFMIPLALSYNYVLQWIFGDCPSTTNPPEVKNKKVNKKTNTNWSRED